MQYIDFKAMGCSMRAVLADTGPEAGDLLARVPGWFAEWEAVLSRFRPDSELSRLNASPGAAVRLSDVLWDVVQAALAAAAWTDGLAAPTVLDDVERSGYDRSFAALAAGNPVADGGISSPRRRGTGGSGRGVAVAARAPSARQLARSQRLARPSALPVLRALRTDPLLRTIMLPAGGRLDLGGVAKGWAADEAVRRLTAFAPALVDAGGDIAAGGLAPSHLRWSVGVGDPFNADGQIAMLALDRGGVATSGRDYRRWWHDGRVQHHIIDPRTGEPAVTDVLSATIIAPSAVRAEAAAKTALILGGRDGLDWVEAHPQLAGLLVTEGGEILASRRLPQYAGG